MENIVYLEGKDFNPDGTLKANPLLGGKPSLVFCYADYCGYCTKAKPAVVELLSRPEMGSNVNVCAIHCDSNNPQDQLALKMMQMSNKDFRGYPAFVLYDGNGRFRGQHEGNRDPDSLVQFARQ